MSRLLRYAGGALASLGLIAGAASVLHSSNSSRPGRRVPPTRAWIRDMDIAFYQGRVERDRFSARDFTQLAGLYLQRARETADNDDLVRAEVNARHSLELRTGRNGAAFGVLATSLLSQHRFVEALGAARRLLQLDSTSISARGLLAETELELGRYDEAGRMFGTLATYRTDLAVAPRLARWEELHGRPEEARRLLRAARDQAERRHGMPQEQLAWLHLRLGDLALRNGHLAEAEDELHAGLTVSPQDYRLLGTMARLELARHRWESAIRYGEDAIGRALDPATLGVIGDAYAALGDTSKARDYHHAMEVTVRHQPGPFHRAWSLFLLDHRHDVPEVLANVSAEIETRRDIYGYDLLAWALHHSGRDAEAVPVMGKALALGTRDAVLFYHAGMIERALGRDEEARKHLEGALQANPYWHPFQPAEARAVLDSLRAR
jgi:tetratricopeptide (TPR) repeat protein